MARTQSSRSSARDRILATAADLFYREGVQNVGIDRIIAESGVAKMSLYNHFKSKDALIAAWLLQQDEAWRSWFQTRVEQSATEPLDRLLAMFDVLEEWFNQPDFRGCAFLNSTVELVDPNHPGYQVSMQHQQLTFDYILGLVQAANLSDPEGITRQVMIIMEGTVVIAMLQHCSGIACCGKQILSTLLEHQ
ncbi:TetR/AcrR family transcriptional regulator [Halomicronema hongdechloris]|nr:TetR/AcrR family transcriptional regulator [Halomicronema hongdechloris]